MWVLIREKGNHNNALTPPISLPGLVHDLLIVCETEDMVEGHLK